MVSGLAWQMVFGWACMMVSGLAWLGLADAF
jgi:hypothetical protein